MDWSSIQDLQLRRGGGRVTVLARQKERLRQRHEVLMAIQLPDHLVVADHGRIEVRHPAPMRPRCVAMADRVEMPVDRLPEVERRHAPAAQNRPESCGVRSLDQRRRRQLATVPGTTRAIA